MRNLGGCRLFVNVLNDPARSRLHDRVINSLNVLMNEGLIPSNVTFLADHTKLEGTVHCCDQVDRLRRNLKSRRKRKLQ